MRGDQDPCAGTGMGTTNHLVVVGFLHHHQPPGGGGFPYHHHQPPGGGRFPYHHHKPPGGGGFPYHHHPPPGGGRFPCHNHRQPGGGGFPAPRAACTSAQGLLHELSGPRARAPTDLADPRGNSPPLALPDASQACATPHTDRQANRRTVF